MKLKSAVEQIEIYEKLSNIQEDFEGQKLIPVNPATHCKDCD